MLSWWISWYSIEPLKTLELHSPWWISGYRPESDDSYTPIIVAAVRAPTEEAAWAVVDAAYDEDGPEFERRFCEELGDREPFSDRWPKAEWMTWTDTATCACDMKHCTGQPQLT